MGRFDDPDIREDHFPRAEMLHEREHPDWVEDCPMCGEKEFDEDSAPYAYEHGHHAAGDHAGYKVTGCPFCYPPAK